MCSIYTSGVNGTVPACPTKCDDGSSLPSKVKATSSAKNVCTSEDSVKNAIVDGYISTRFDVFEDFTTYVNGIY